MKRIVALALLLVALVGAGCGPRNAGLRSATGPRTGTQPPTATVEGTPALPTDTAPAVKAFHIVRLTMDVDVADDGSMLVEEEREVEFTGRFSWVQWDLSSGGADGIEVEGVSLGGRALTRSGGGIGTSPKKGTYVTAVEPNRVLVKVGFSASDETLPFVIRYKVVGAAKRWRDTSELYWQFVGAETAVDAEAVRVNIQLPPPFDKTRTYAWGHGPDNLGVEQGKGGFVVLHALGLPPNTFVEGRILFPAEALARVPAQPEPKLEQAVSEEQ